MKFQVITKVLLVILAFISVIIPRILFHNFTPLYYHYPDTFHYLVRAREIREGQSAISPFRLPLYPFILHKSIQTPIPDPVNSSTFGSIDVRPVILLQKYAGLIGSLIFLFIAIRIFSFTKTMLLACILFGTNILIIGYEINLITETFSTLLFLAVFLTFVLYIDSHKSIFLFASVVTSTLLFLLRPVFIVYPLIFIPITAFYFKRKKMRAKILLSLLIIATYFLVPLTYALVNKRVHRYFGITSVAGHNLFAKIIQYELDTSWIAPNNTYEQSLKDCANLPRNKQSIVIDDCVRQLQLPSNPYDTVSSPILDSFAKKIIFNQPITYIAKSVNLFPQALVGYFPEPFEWISPWSAQSQLYEFWKFSNLFFRVLQKFMLLYFIFFPISIWAFWKKTDRRNTILVIMGTSIMYLLFFNTFFVQSEYDRLRAPIEPIILLFCLYYYQKLFVWLKDGIIRGKNAIEAFLQTKRVKPPKSKK